MDSLFTQLAQYGLGGLITAIALILIVGVARELRACWDARLADWKALSELLQTNQVTMREVVASSEARTRAQEAMARSMEMAALAQNYQTEEIKRLQTSNGELRTEIGRLRDSLTDLRPRGGA